MNLRIIISCCFTICASILFAQASWSYSVKFQLVSKENQLISLENLNDGKVELLTYADGAHLDSEIEFDSLNNTFIFSQHTITGSSVLVFETLKDTTILHFETTNLDLGVIKLTGKEYSFRVWNEEDRFFKPEINDSYWKRKHPLASYLIAQEKRLKIYTSLRAFTKKYKKDKF